MSHNSYLTTLIEELEKAILLARKMEESGSQPAIEQAILLEKLRNTYDLVLFQDPNSFPKASDNLENINHPDQKSSIQPPKILFEPKKKTKTTSDKDMVEESTIHSSKIESSATLKEKPAKAIATKIDSPTVTSENKAAKQSETIGEKLRSGKRFLNEYLIENTDKHDLASLMQTKPIKDLSKAIGINDKFLFTRELFGGDSQQFQNVIHALNNMNSIEEALIYVGDNFDWQASDPTVIKLIELLQRRFINQP
jgi:hypothetical protein